ncbi:MAG: glycoside hydrolase [Bacteroidales bacterium]|nr:glycoside hydrolase [Bacteroidales bacterium]
MLKSLVFFLLLLTGFNLAGSEPLITVKYDSTFTGRGNEGELLFDAFVVPDGEFLLSGLALESDCTSDDDISAFVLEFADSSGCVLGTEEFAADKIAEAGIFSLRSPVNVSAPVRLRVRADISPAACEGNKVSLKFLGIYGADGTMWPAPLDGYAQREILLCRKRLYAPGDYGSRNWRIPALLALPDGALLAVNDKRKYNETDLPEDIDIVARRSVDNGRTWSEPVDIIVGRGYKKGYGDPALALAPDGSVVCVFVGGNGLWASTAADPQSSYCVRSSDGGITWSEPVNITSVLWGQDAVNPQCRNYTYSFFGSGNGLLLRTGEHAGRILFAAAMGPARHLNNHAVYSDDGGLTWNVSDIAFEGGDEAKMVELADGRILMSVRRTGYRGYSISDDGGVTWHGDGLWTEMNTNACNGDMIRYSLADEDGGSRNLILHSIPNSMERRNVSIFCSYDEGLSWCSPKTICPDKSVYSSMTVLNDGTIGIYVEENPVPEDCSLWFMNFSLDWLIGKGR